jgi:hypothetical protein
MTTNEWKAIRTRVKNGEIVVLDFSMATDPIDQTVAAARAVFDAGSVTASYGMSEHAGVWKLRIAKG